jgi:anti-anti-sigma factor
MASRSWRIDEYDELIHVTVAPQAGTLLDTSWLDEVARVKACLAGPVPRHLVVDFSECQFFGSSMLETLLHLKRVVEEQGKQLVVCGLTESTAGVLRLARFDKLVKVAADLQEARKAVVAPPSPH